MKASAEKTDLQRRAKKENKQKTKQKNEQEIQRENRARAQPRLLVSFQFPFCAPEETPLPLGSVRYLSNFLINSILGSN